MLDTPRGNRIHIAFFGLRNAGKSTLVNAFTGQQIAIVSDVAGTTTDPVSKAMEILPLGPCMITDTAGLDDEGALGELRVKKSLDVLSKCDVAIWVASDGDGASPARERFFAECSRRGVAVLEYARGEDVAAFRSRVAAIKIAEPPRGLLDGLAAKGDIVVCVCPIDESAPKGRLILPQVQLIRECLDIGALCRVTQVENLAASLPATPCLVVTDSQAFKAVADILEGFPAARLTSFSVLFARQKGDLESYIAGVEAARHLKDGDTVLIAEGCTHHRQCNDIGTVKIPKALERLCGAHLNFVFASGGDFPLGANAAAAAPIRLIVQCGGCMLTRREVLRRISLATEAGIPIANYGLILAAAARLPLERLARPL